MTLVPQEKHIMPMLEYNKETMPSPEEFIKVIRESSEQYDPVEELLRLERELVRLEQEHNMSSPEFYRQYQNGQLGDDVTIIEWAGRYRLYLRLKQAISESLNLVITSQTAALI
jgi:hypothetical protein